jgi:predicted transglutaminase-like protease
MLYVIERKRPIRTLRGWAISMLQEAGAIRECEYHGWLIDCADPYALERALEIARQDVPANISPHRAITEMLDVLGRNR